MRLLRNYKGDLPDPVKARPVGLSDTRELEVLAIIVTLEQHVITLADEWLLRASKVERRALRARSNPVT